MNRIFILVFTFLSFFSSAQNFKIPEPNQNVKDAFSLASSIYTSYRGNQNYQNRLEDITSVTLSFEDPDQLLYEFKKRLKKIEIEAERRKRQKEKEIEKQIELANKTTDKALDAADVDLGAGGAILKWAVKEGVKSASKNNARKKIERMKQEAAKELEQMLKKEMGNIYQNVVEENETAKSKYLEAAAKTYSQEKETYFIESFQYHQCVLEELKANYDYRTTDWLENTCIKPNKSFPVSTRYKTNNRNKSKSNLSDKARIAQIQRQKQKSLQKVELLIKNAETATEKVEYLSMKQDIKKEAQQKIAQIKGTQKRSGRKYHTKSTYNNSLVKIARRKYKLYKSSMPFKVFLESAKKFAEAALAEEPNNPEAYLFFAQLKDDPIEQFSLAASALYLDRYNSEYKRKFQKYKSKFAKELFQAIRTSAALGYNKSHIDFIKRANNNNLLKGFKHDGKTPFAVALKSDNLTVLEILNHRGFTNKQVIQYAIKAGSEKIAKSYINKLPLNNYIGIGGYDLLSFAVLNNQYSIAKHILSKGYSDLYAIRLSKRKNHQLYHKVLWLIADYSVENNTIKDFERVLKLGGSEIAKQKYEGEMSVVQKIVANNKLKYARVLNKYNFPFAKYSQSKNLLELAIKQDAEEICLWLIKNGANTKEKPSNGGTLINLVASKQDMNSVLEKLINQDVDMNLSDNKGHTPIEIAFLNEQYEKAEMLIKNNASLEFKPNNGGNQYHWVIDHNISADFFKLLLNHNINIDQIDGNGDTPLLLALKKNKNEHAEFLIESGANVDISNSRKFTPLMLSLYDKDLLSYKIARKCKYPDKKGPNDWTALHFAARENDIQVAYKLIEQGANLMCRDRWGQTPYRVAIDNQNEQVANILKEKMSAMDVLRSARFTVNPKK